MKWTLQWSFLALIPDLNWAKETWPTWPQTQEMRSQSSVDWTAHLEEKERNTFLVKRCKTCHSMKLILFHPHHHPLIHPWMHSSINLSISGKMPSQAGQTALVTSPIQRVSESLVQVRPPQEEDNACPCVLSVRTGSKWTEAHIP